MYRSAHFLLVLRCVRSVATSKRPELSPRPSSGGLLLSTMLTLLVIPCSYTYFDDFARFLSRRVFRRKIDEERPAPPRPEPAVVD
jgi:hypothetical protein